MNFRLILVLSLLVGKAAAQSAPVPAAYQNLYNELQGKLTTWDSSISAQWDGTKYPTQFSAELLYANSNSGLLLLSPNVPARYREEIKALKSLGVQAVVLKLGYPFLYQPFLKFNGDPGDYASIVSFYQGVVNDVHAAGMKVIAESSAIFPGFYSTGSGLNVTGWYSSQSYANLLAGYAAQNAVIAMQIKPDYLNVGGSEPDTEAKNTGHPEFNTPDGWAAAINAFVSQIPPGSGMKIGAGVGTWLIGNGEQFLQSILTKTNVDYIDFHLYPINTPGNSTTSIPQNAETLIDQALAAGKQVAFSEAWLLKTSDASYQQANASSDPTTFSLDSLSFFAPLDQAFLQAMWKLSNSKRMLYVSPFWSRYFWAYLDYTQVSSLSASDLVAASQAAAATAIANGQVSVTGQFYKSLLSTPVVNLESSASLAVGPVAPNSFVSLFGSGFGVTGGATMVTIADKSGVAQPAALSYVSPTQVNALLPASLAAGPATFTVTALAAAPANFTMAAQGLSVVSGGLLVEPVAPGIFTANSSGVGVAAAETFTLHADGSTMNDFVFTCPASGVCVPKPINVAAPGDTVYLILYGTGFRNRSAIANTAVAFGSQSFVPAYAGSQNTILGLDQINVVIPSSLAGAGLVSVVFRADRLTSNAVTVQIQ